MWRLLSRPIAWVVFGALSKVLIDSIALEVKLGGLGKPRQNSFGSTDSSQRLTCYEMAKSSCIR